MITKLETPVTFTTPIQLNWDNNFPGDDGTASTGYPLTILGFGSTIGGPDTAFESTNIPIMNPRILQQAPTEYVAFDDCAVAEDPETGKLYGLSPTQTGVQDYWFCTLYNDPITTGTCYGDSGGPVIDEQGSDASGDLLMAVISGASGYCGNPYLPLWNNRVSFHKDWIVKTGCELSVDPPPEWNCDQGGIAPDGPVVSQPTSPPPTSRPPTTPPPTEAEVTTTPQPTRRPSTPAPTEAEVVSTPAPSLRPSTPRPTASPTRSPTTPSPVEDDNGDDDESLTLPPEEAPPAGNAEITDAPMEPTESVPTVEPTIAPSRPLIAIPGLPTVSPSASPSAAPNNVIVIPSPRPDGNEPTPPSKDDDDDRMTTTRLCLFVKYVVMDK